MFPDSSRVIILSTGNLWKTSSSGFAVSTDRRTGIQVTLQQSSLLHRPDLRQQRYVQCCANTARLKVREDLWLRYLAIKSIILSTLFAETVRSALLTSPSQVSKMSCPLVFCPLINCLTTFCIQD